jgi:hypothetical protein
MTTKLILVIIINQREIFIKARKRWYFCFVLLNSLKKNHSKKKYLTISILCYIFRALFSYSTNFNILKLL